MTFNEQTERWENVTDADVRWMATQGYNANEVAAIAHTTRYIADIWMEMSFVQGVAA